MLNEDTNAIIEGRGRAIDALIKERASLQTALAAATERIETWREALAKCEADRSATKDELAAANARADEYQKAHEAIAATTPTVTMLQLDLQRATARAEAAEGREATVAAQAARIEALERTLNTIAEMSATQSSGFAGVIRGTALASLRQGQPASEGET